MKVRVDSFAWFQKADLDVGQLEGLRREMTIIPTVHEQYDDGETKPIHLYQETETEFGIAREYFIERRQNRHVVEFDVSRGGDDWHPAEFNPEVKLRFEQQQALDTVDQKFEAGHHGGMVRAVPGWGKTVLGCAIMARLKVPTLVVVHKEFLMNQWFERITGEGEDNTAPAFLPDAKVGRIQQDVCDYKGKTVVLAMVHSLASRRYPDDFYDWPGLIIVDESLGYDSRILTREGYRPIGEIVEAPHEDVDVLAYDVEADRFTWRPVTRRFAHKPRSRMLRIRHERGVFECTAKHEVLTASGYVTAEKLTPGSDLLVCHDRVESRPLTLPSASDSSIPEALLWGSKGISGGDPKPSRVLSVKTIVTPELVYDLTVEEHHNFVVEGVVAHNCHRMGAYTWAPVPAKFRSRYRLGLSATPRRKDGADNVFYYHLGPVLFSAKEKRMKPKIRRVWTKFKLVKTLKFNPNLASKAIVLRFLCASVFRNRLIVELMIEALAKNRKLIILSERLNHLDALDKMLGEMWPTSYGASPTTGYYVGGRKKEQLKEAAKARVIFATWQFAAEGLDIPALDTLFMVTPMSDVEQGVGRILRPFEGKQDPVVVDLRDDSVGMFHKMGKTRDKFYSKIG